ncbi:MAG TPA: alpha/beta hydrolase [Mycobacterium sp.]|nr:alpha/beta hydrolase [Mycobacterium sp.]
MTAALTSGPSPAAVRPTAGDVEHGHVERTVTTGDGVRLAVRDYRCERADDPTVVLLHGLLLTQDSWDLQVTRLRRQYGRRIRIVTYDHRGHGRSSAAPMPTYRIEQLAEDLATVLSSLDITGPLTLAGHSMGGMAALAYLGRPTSARPVQPRGLVLVGTAAGGLADRGIGRLLASPATGALFGLVHRMPRSAADKAVETITQPLGAVLGRFAGDRSAIAAVAAAAVRATSLATATGFLPSLKSFDTYDALASITAKTVVVSGGADMLTPASHSRDMTSAIPDSVHHHHPTAGHMLLQDAAECVSKAIGRAMGTPRRAAKTESRSGAAQLAVIVP